MKVGDVAVAGTRRPQFSSGAITVIAREQSIVLELLARLERDAGEIAKRRLLQDQVISELAERVAGSERLLYRAVRSLLHDGWETARQQFPGRARTRRLMHQLDGLEPTHPTFAPLVHSVVTRLRRGPGEHPSPAARRGDAAELGGAGRGGSIVACRGSSGRVTAAASGQARAAPVNHRRRSSRWSISSQ